MGKQLKYLAGVGVGGGPVINQHVWDQGGGKHGEAHRADYGTISG